MYMIMYTHSSLTGVSETHITLALVTAVIVVGLVIVLCGIYVAAVLFTVKCSCTRIFHL